MQLTKQILTRGHLKFGKIQTIFPNFRCPRVKQFSQFQMSPRQNLFRQFYVALAIEATELNLDFFGIRMMSNPLQTRGGMAHKMDRNFTMLGAMLK